MVRIVVFGDSIAWGANDGEELGWVNRLAKFYKDEDNISMYNCAISGDSSEDVLFRFDIESEARYREKEDYNIVIFAIGINDTQNIRKKGEYNVSIEKFRDNLNTLILLSRKYYDKIVFIGLTNVDEKKTLPIPWSPEKSYYSVDAMMYDRVVKEVARRSHAEYIPMFDIPTELMDDGLHPNAKGHERIFQRVKEVTDKILDDASKNP